MVDFARVFWQGSQPWGQQTLLGGPDLIERGGCYVVSITHAIRRIRKLDVTPDQVNAKAIKDGYYQADNVQADKICGSWGLHAPSAIEGKPMDRAVMVALTQALRLGQMAFCHFDLDDDGKADHWCLADKIYEGRVSAIRIACSALARHIPISGFYGDTFHEWDGIPKHYRLMAVRPVYAANAAK